MRRQGGRNFAAAGPYACGLSWSCCYDRHRPAEFLGTYESKHFKRARKVQGRGRHLDAEQGMLKVLLWIVGIIFLIGLLVVFGILDFLF